MVIFPLICSYLWKTFRILLVNLCVMCGIFGLIGKNLSELEIKEIISLLKRRGIDYTGIEINEENTYIHCLHSIIDNIKQPLKGNDRILLYNGEIYNWKKLKEKYHLKSENDTEVLFSLLQSKGINCINELDGMFAFAYDDGEKVFLARDILGIKPLVYSKYSEAQFAFASEGKVLKKINLEYEELNPKEILVYNKKTKSISKLKREFFVLPKESKLSKSNIKEELKPKLIDSVKLHTEGVDDFGILFSGGIDSTLLALLCKKLNKKFTCYVSSVIDKNLRDPPDLIASRKVSKEYNLKLKEVLINKKELEKLLPEIIDIIESNDIIKVSVALPFYLAAKEAKKDNKKILLSGLGSEELFAGYERHYIALKNGKSVNGECLNGLSELWKRDLYRDDMITMHNTIELRLPFLNCELINFALSIPSKYKINEEHKKIILREVAEELGLSKEFAWRKKLGAQYGSNTDKIIQKIAKEHGFKSKREYVESLTTTALDS